MQKNDQVDIFITGVGGQGTILAGKVISTVALLQDLDVKLSETHGMAQRGGSVVTHVRLGPKVYSPLAEKGEVDFLLAFEQLEALRWLDYLSPTGTVIVNRQKLEPLPVLTGVQEYPREILARIRGLAGRTVAVDALQETAARENPRVVNMVLVGILASLLDLPASAWEEALQASIPPRLLELNLRAFRDGYNYQEKENSQ